MCAEMAVAKNRESENQANLAERQEIPNLSPNVVRALNHGIRRESDFCEICKWDEEHNNAGSVAHEKVNHEFDRQLKELESKQQQLAETCDSFAKSPVDSTSNFKELAAISPKLEEATKLLQEQNEIANKTWFADQRPVIGLPIVFRMQAAEDIISQSLTLIGNNYDNSRDLSDAAKILAQYASQVKDPMHKKELMQGASDMLNLAKRALSQVVVVHTKNYDECLSQASIQEFSMLNKGLDYTLKGAATGFAVCSAIDKVGALYAFLKKATASTLSRVELIEGLKVVGLTLGVRASIGAGIEAAYQWAAIADGTQDRFHFSGLPVGAAVGIAFPEFMYRGMHTPLAASMFALGAGKIADGQPYSGGVDVAMGVALPAMSRGQGTTKAVETRWLVPDEALKPQTPEAESNVVNLPPRPVPTHDGMDPTYKGAASVAGELPTQDTVGSPKASKGSGRGEGQSGDKASEGQGGEPSQAAVVKPGQSAKGVDSRTTNNEPVTDTTLSSPIVEGDPKFQICKARASEIQRDLEVLKNEIDRRKSPNESEAEWKSRLSELDKTQKQLERQLVSAEQALTRMRGGNDAVELLFGLTEGKGFEEIAPNKFEININPSENGRVFSVRTTAGEEYIIDRYFLFDSIGRHSDGLQLKDLGNRSYVLEEDVPSQTFANRLKSSPMIDWIARDVIESNTTVRVVGVSSEGKPVVSIVDGNSVTDSQVTAITEVIRNNFYKWLIENRGETINADNLEQGGHNSPLELTADEYEELYWEYYETELELDRFPAQFRVWLNKDGRIMTSQEYDTFVLNKELAQERQLERMQSKAFREGEERAREQRRLGAEEER